MGMIPACKSSVSALQPEKNKPVDRRVCFLMTYGFPGLHPKAVTVAIATAAVGGEVSQDSQDHK
jgi:hypothetical protein